MSRSFSCKRDLLADELAVLEERLVGRVDDQDAVEAIQQGVLAALQLAAGVLQADHGGDAQRARHDGGVRGLAADVGGEAQHVALVQLRGVGGRQVVADDDARLLEVAQVHLLLEAQQVVEDARGHIPHVGGPFPQVIVLDGGQRGRVALGDRVEGVFGVDLLLLDHPHDFVEQRAVLQHQQVRVKDAAFLGAHACADFALDLEELLAGLDQRPFQAVDLLRQLRLGQLRVCRCWAGARPRHEDEPRPPGTPRGNRNAAETHLALMRRLWHGRYLAESGRLKSISWREI